jgi:hypothetical protein
VYSQNLAQEQTAVPPHPQSVMWFFQAVAAVSKPIVKVATVAVARLVHTATVDLVVMGVTALDKARAVVVAVLMAAARAVVRAVQILRARAVQTV